MTQLYAIALVTLALVLSALPAHPGPLEDLQPGRWLQIPNSKLAAVLPSPLPPGGSPANITEAWNSGAFDTKRNRLLVTGGGHNDYGGNEVYAFDVPTLKWSKLWNRFRPCSGRVPPAMVCMVPLRVTVVPRVPSGVMAVVTWAEPMVDRVLSSRHPLIRKAPIRRSSP